MSIPPVYHNRVMSIVLNFQIRAFLKGNPLENECKLNTVQFMQER